MCVCICMSMSTLQTSRLRVWFPMVSLEFFSDIILPVAPWPWGQLSLWQKWVPGVFPGGKGGLCIRLTTFVMKSGNINFLEPSGPLQACDGTALPFTFICMSMCICVYVHMCAYMYVFVCVYICTYVCMCVKQVVMFKMVSPFKEIITNYDSKLMSSKAIRPIQQRNGLKLMYSLSRLKHVTDMRNNWMLEHLCCCIGLITTEDINLIKYNKMALLKVNTVKFTPL